MIEMRTLFGVRQSENVWLQAERAEDGIPDSLWETYSAFANTAGGMILLGVEELPDGHLRPRGVADADGMVERLRAELDNPGRVSRNILLPGQLYVQTVNDADIIVMEVPRAVMADRPIHINGDPYTGSFVRMGNADIRCERWQIVQMLSQMPDRTVETPLYDGLAELPREKLCELLACCAGNWMDHDEFWFASVAGERGAEEAGRCRAAAGTALARVQAERIKAFLGLPERAGLDGLRRALGFRLCAILGRDEICVEGNTITYRVLEAGRGDRATELPLGALVKEADCGEFAAALDDRIVTERDGLIWRFTLIE